MKKTFFLTICLLLVLLSGCGKAKVKLCDYYGLPLLQTTEEEALEYIRNAIAADYSDENGTPVLTDEFCQSKFNVNSVEELISRTKSSLDFYSYADQLMEILLERCEVTNLSKSEVGKKTLQNYDDFMKRVREAAQKYNVGEESVLHASGYADSEELWADCEANAREIITYQYIVLEIAEEENLKISESDYENMLDKYALINGYSSSEEFIDSIGEDNILYSVLMEEVLRFLIEHAVIY